MRPSAGSLYAWGHAAGPPAVLVVLGLATAWKSSSLGYWTSIGPGPGFFPLWLGVLLSVLGIAWAFQRHRHVPLDNADAPAKDVAPAQSAPGSSAASDADVEHALEHNTSGSLVSAAEMTADPSHINVPEELETPIPYKRALVTVVSLVVLAMVMTSLGYRLSMLIFLVLHLKLGTKANWVTIVLISVAGSFGVYAVFTNLLQVYLPSATIPFLHSLGL